MQYIRLGLSYDGWEFPSPSSMQPSGLNPSPFEIQLRCNASIFRQYQIRGYSKKSVSWSRPRREVRFFAWCSALGCRERRRKDVGVSSRVDVVGSVSWPTSVGYYGIYISWLYLRGIPLKKSDKRPFLPKFGQKMVFSLLSSCYHQEWSEWKWFLFHHSYRFLYSL